MPIDRRATDASIDELRAPLVELSQKLHDNPELRWEEFRATAWITETLENHGGVRVERELCGYPTAFRARVGAGERPLIAILAEYDALPEIGHACGHNLIAGGAVGAFLALARLGTELPGAVEIIGTPGEEGGAGKIRLIEKGVFDGVDVAMMFHPFDRDLLAHPALASKWVELRFKGTPSHASAAPWEGKSALTACLETFRLIDSQRVHFRDGVRVHGFVTNGGQAVNIIPEHAAAEFSVRAPSNEELERVQGIVERCARGAALACGVEVELSVRTGYREMRNNLTLARRFGAALSSLGRPGRESDDRVGAGSTDMGDVSQVVPAIHPYLAICDEGESLCHEHRFLECAASERGFETMLVGAKAMARTALDLLDDPELVAAVKREWTESRT
ncbi:MAG: M20 family metallopeptidase [Myxococcales bacterium]|nr:M20 family metallopeptidase [Myxococcales bacterium]